MKFNPAVDEFMAQDQHPLRVLLQKVREIILSVDERVEEAIKWKTPTFMFKGNIASFMKAKKFVSLMFHKGALIKDEYGLLEGDGKEARVARFYSLEDIEEKREALEALIQAWIGMNQ